MSWFDSARLVFAMGAVAALSGCFQPLYGEVAHPGLVEAMREVQVVVPVPTRIGHYLGDDLITRMNGSGSSPSAQYRLIVGVGQYSQTPTIESQIETADAATVVGIADFSLIKIEGQKLIYHGTATGVAVYDRSLQGFADLRAARDAEIRLARTLSDEIELRVAAALGQAKL